MSINLRWHEEKALIAVVVIVLIGLSAIKRASAQGSVTDEFGGATQQANMQAGGDGPRQFGWHVLNGSAADLIDVDVTNPGALTIDHGPTWTNNYMSQLMGPLVYKILTGDFDIETHVSHNSDQGYEGTALTVRDPNSLLEDHIQFKHVFVIGPGLINEFLDTNDGSSNIVNGPYEPFLRIKRMGSSFSLYSKSSAVCDWVLRRVLDRPDLGPDLQVGISTQTANTTNTFVSIIECFRETGESPEPPEPPVIATDEFGGATQQANMQAGGDGPRLFGWNVLNASAADLIDVDVTNPGALTIDHGPTWTNNYMSQFMGPFVYKILTGDFDIETLVSHNSDQGYEGTALLVRAPCSLLDHIQIKHVFSGLASGFFNEFMDTNDGYTTTAFGPYVQFMRIKRAGSTFSLYAKAMPDDPWTLGRVIDRPGFGPSLQVGISTQTANSTDTFVSVIEYFRGSTDSPFADAGSNFSVNEGQSSVMLDGSGSSDPNGAPLTYAWAQLAGTTVTLSDPAASQPTFDAPLVAIGGETLTFELTVSANGESASDTVSVAVVNVNHPPVADAGDDQSIAEGAPLILHGEDSFDVDNDPFTYSWTQVSGPVVTLYGATSANPTCAAPFVGGGGAPGVVAILVFELTVADSFPFDTPTPGYTFADVADSVTIEVTNVNNDPTSRAGSDQTKDENAPVSLDGSASDDPDSDSLTYSWTQVGGTPVALSGDMTAVPSFTAPFVSSGGDDLAFELTVNDGFGGSATDTVVVHVQNINDPPLVSAAAPTIGTLWPPAHCLVPVGITGVSDPNNNATIAINAVFQDEPTNGQGDGDTAIDAIIISEGMVLLRAERAGGGNGRVYHIHFTASDLEGSASGVVTVCVPKKKKVAAINDGELYDSTN